MNVYSFKNVSCMMIGPGIAANLAAGAGAAEEGLTIEPTTDKNKMDIGADGKGQHSLIADDSGKITVRLLKTSTVNGLLMAAYDAQSSSSALWGQNVITILDTARGEGHICQSVAFKKKPVIDYAKEAKFIDWELEAIKISSILAFT